MIYNNNSTTSASSLSMLYNLCDCGGPRCICIWILALFDCQLLSRLAFRIYRLARRGPLILITGTTSDVLRLSHLKDLRKNCH